MDENITGNIYLITTTCRDGFHEYHDKAMVSSKYKWGEHPKAEDDVTEQCYLSWNYSSCQDADNQNWYTDGNRLIRIDEVRKLKKSEAKVMQKHGVAYCYNLDEIIKAQLPDLEAYWNEQMEMEANANV